MSAQQTSLLSDLTQFASDFTFEGFTFEAIVNNFHFIRPWWLLSFFALFIVLFLLKKIRYYQSPWQHFLPAHLANALLENSHRQTAQKTQATSSQARYWLKPSVIGSCIIFALAGPAWQKLPQPVYQLARGAVLIMDMSYSMYATDMKPNRLTRSRYKAIDLLKKINEGDVGLIAYAGDAFIISPLTQDIKNIELLLPSLSPDIMPVHGANALAALTLADQTLKNAGHISGDIYWFTDDIDNEEMSDVYDWANDNSHKVNILGIGSKTGAPIKLTSGKLLKDNKGAIVIPKLPESRLSAITQRSRGVYHNMTNDDTDIKALTAHLSTSLDDKVDPQTSKNANKQQSKQVMQGDLYQEQGPWLLIIILPLLLSYFRRGTSILAITWLMPLTLLFSFASISPVSYAAAPNIAQVPTALEAETATQSNVNSASQLWQDLWQTSDQQAQQHYQQKNYQQAAKQFEDSQWQGSAHYKAGDYEQALQAFKQGNTAQALYNQGNSLAQLQKIDEAIEAYKKALEKDPNLSDAKENLAKLEELKKQQEQSKKDSKDKSQESSDDDKQEKGDKQNSQENQDSESQSQDQSQEDQQQEGDQSSQDNKEQKQEKSQEQKDKEANDSEEAQKKQEEQAAQAKESDEEQQGDEKSLAQQAIDKKAQETEQKHQQLLNKVTDDPYLLLRNKMRLEYQKRRNEGAPLGVTKKW